MAGQLHHPDTGEDPGGARRQALTSRQRWSRIALILVVTALIVAMIVLHLTGTFGPGRHG